MATALERVTWAYNYIDKLAGQGWPYTFGGGHGVPPLVEDGKAVGFPATQPPGTLQRGFDCSSWVSNAVFHGGFLNNGGIQGHAKEALNTEEFEQWGAAGAGQFMTIWVLDELTVGGIHHCFMEFKLPGKPHRWSAATHSGTICGWHDRWDNWVTAGFHPRHPIL